MTLLHRTLVAALVVLTALIGVMQPPAYAEPVPSSSGISKTTRTQDLRHIEDMLGDPVVLQGLHQAGTDPGEIRHMLPRMTDHDVHLLAQKMDTVKTGGIGVIEILVIVILVLVIIYLVR